MNSELLIAFVAATVLLVAIPGPNVAVIIANTLSYGLRHGLATVAGTASAIAIQLIVVVFATDLLASGQDGAFEALRALGIGYLLWLALSAWRAAPDDVTSLAPAPRSLASLMGGGLMVGLSNPKTWLFYGAFFPQFIDARGDVASQLRILAIIFFVLTTILDGLVTIGAAQFRGVLNTSPQIRNRLTAIVLVVAALGLMLVRAGAKSGS